MAKFYSPELHVEVSNTLLPIIRKYKYFPELIGYWTPMNSKTLPQHLDLDIFQLVILFTRYENSKQGLEYFANDKYIYRRPNTMIHLYEYNPKTGEKVNIELIKTIVKEFILNYNFKN